jgi:hypothetical protein
MGFEKAGIVYAVCDGCEPDWWIVNLDLDGRPWWSSTQAAREQLAGIFGWSITGRRGRRTTMLCDACTSKADCKEHGHDGRYTPPTHWNGRTLRPSYDCQRCGATRSTVLPPGHPESIDLELPHDQEEMLAALDAELFGGETT